MRRSRHGHDHVVTALVEEDGDARRSMIQIAGELVSNAVEHALAR